MPLAGARGRGRKGLKFIELWGTLERGEKKVG